MNEFGSGGCWSDREMEIGRIKHIVRHITSERICNKYSVTQKMTVACSAGMWEQNYSRLCKNLCTHTHTYTDTYIHTYTHTYTDTYIHTYIHTHIHTYIIHSTHIHAHIHTYIHTYVYWTMHHLDSWINTDQLDVTCFIISLFKAQHV